jgi:hypothetical protein
MARRSPRSVRWLLVLLVPGLAVGLLGTGNCAPQGNLNVGVCKADITPVTPDLADDYEASFGVPAVVNHTDPIWMAGFGTGRAAQGYHDRLWARGMVVESEGVRVAIVALDVVGYFVNEIETIRSLVGPAVDYVLVTSTHQHEGPDTLGLWGPDDTTSGIDYGYLDFVNQTVADCIGDAVASLEPARLHRAETDSSGLSLGLDVEDDGLGVGDGKVLAGDAVLAPATDGRIVDPRLGALVFTKRSPPFETLATLANFASHPESMGSGNVFITADFPHYARERLEAEYGGVAIWLSGDLGVLQGPLDLDVEDPLTGMPAARRTFRWAEVHGTQLAERLIEAIDAVRFVEVDLGDVTLRLPPGSSFVDVGFSTVSPVPIRLDNPYFRVAVAIGVLNQRRSLYTDGVPDASVGFPYPFPFDEIPQALGEDVQTEVGAIRIGKSQIAAVPTELDPQIGETYRQALVDNGAEQTFIFGLAGDHIGYQVPFAKWDDSCHFCAPYILAGFPALCPVQPIDCNTVFENNVGQQVDPEVTAAFQDAVSGL